MARTLDQIIAELNPTYQPQIQSVQTQLGQIPGQIQVQEQAVGAQKDQAYEDIISGARRRGLGFAGIPLGEQAKYAATNYAPALANLRQAGVQQATSLQDAINQIQERRDTLARSIQGTEQANEFSALQTQKANEFSALEAQKAREWQARQAELDRKATAANTAASTISPTDWSSVIGGGYSPTTEPAVSKPYYDTAALSSGKGFYFYDAKGTPINALQFSKMTGKGFRAVLQEMVGKGDANAKIALDLLNKRIITENGRGTNLPAQYKANLTALGISGDKWSAATGSGGRGW